MSEGKGWHRHSREHALASRGIPTKDREVRTYQARFNPEAIDSNPPISECVNCGGKFHKREFSDECPTCTTISKYLEQEDQKPKPIQREL